MSNYLEILEKLATHQRMMIHIIPLISKVGIINQAQQMANLVADSIDLLIDDNEEEHNKSLKEIRHMIDYKLPFNPDYISNQLKRDQNEY